jgi:hypothetical protein
MKNDKSQRLKSAGLSRAARGCGARRALDPEVEFAGAGHFHGAGIIREALRFQDHGGRASGSLRVAGEGALS